MNSKRQIDAHVQQNLILLGKSILAATDLDLVSFRYCHTIHISLIGYQNPLRHSPTYITHL